MVDYLHLHVRGIGRPSHEFQPHTADDEEEPPRRVPNRRRHAADLSGQLMEARLEIERLSALQKEFGIPASKRGIAIAAQSREKEYLRVGEVKLHSPGLKLLSLKKMREAPDLANFFVTKLTLKGMIQQIEKYADYADTGSTPYRFNLWESVGLFRIATIEDLWTGSADEVPERSSVLDWEIWVRPLSEPVFRRCIERLGIRTLGTPTAFSEALIFNVRATYGEIVTLVQASAAVVELRSASSFVREYLDFDPEERVAALDEVMARVQPPPASAPRTVILDTGVNHANPLVGIALDAEDCVTIDPTWVTNDHSGHGTHMAGIALYGDLERVVESDASVQLQTRLESTVVSAPAGSPPLAAHEALRRAVALLPRDNLSRVLCLAQTAPNDLRDGRQTPLSGVVDEAAWSDGVDTRLLCVAAGNAQLTVDMRLLIAPYDNRNAAHLVETPGQAVNALTVGACTHRLSEDWEPLADEGDLSPTSRTTQQWNVHYAYKPDIVMEGGNHELDGSDPLFSAPIRESQILTAGRNYPTHPFAWSGETSAATARAAGLATRLKAAYPAFRAETLRGMMVHCADWTPAMLARREEVEKIGLAPDAAKTNLLQTYGWGVPHEHRLFRSANDDLTIIVEDELIAYREGASNRPALAEMRYFVLPWPQDVLRELNQDDVELRVTLSYFVEPSPHAASRNRRDRYPSHRLRFAVKEADMSHLDAQQAVNRLASEDDVAGLEDTISLGRAHSDEGWFLGDRRRRRGTIHHDIWKGKAHELAKRDGISIYPVRGWWSETSDTDHIDRPVRFTLIASVRAPGTTLDLTASAMARVTSGMNVVTAAVAV